MRIRILLIIVFILGVVADASAFDRFCEDPWATMTKDEKSRFANHDFFRLPGGASLEDSLKALHISGLERKRGFLDRYCVVVGTIAQIREPELEDLDFLLELKEDEMIRREFRRGLSMLTLEVDSVLHGDCEPGHMDCFTMIPTPTRGFDIADRKRQMLFEGYRFVGLVSQEGLGGNNSLLRCFVFGRLGSDSYLSRYEGAVIGLYREAARKVRASVGLQ